MPQDRDSGAAANQWGRETARYIASQIGATMQSRASNEALLNGQNVVIKCAAPATNSVGVTYKMLEKLDAVIGAFQSDDGSFPQAVACTQLCRLHNLSDTLDGSRTMLPTVSRAASDWG